ncbi:hypothetical protein [Glycomyces tenuis]|uniref:hypothetical protein n=1 Tax=Glycomyces tenuis TaxID=58116 RepID=UPI0003FF0E15|nr:hypothetical protein [Glycomyces tenuis]
MGERAAPDRTNSTFRADLVPTWAKIAAWAVPVTCLPSITWRLTMAIDVIANNEYCRGSGPLWEKIYITGVLPTVQLGLALLTIGLIRPWGEVFPRWIPGLGGRRVPITGAVVAATTGAILVGAVWTLGFLPDVMSSFWAELGYDRPPGNSQPPAGCSDEPPGWEIMRWYVPMLLWSPLLLAVTWHYRRRRLQEGR